MRSVIMYISLKPVFASGRGKSMSDITFSWSKNSTDNYLNYSII